MIRLRKLSPALLALFAALALSACGESDTKVTTGTYAGESGKNAPYLNVGPLVYQVQLSRELNPANAEDSAYLQGLPPAERQLGTGEEWFALFMQVYNHNSHPYKSTSAIAIYDTQGNTYLPVPLALTNEFAYRGGLVPAKGQVPEPGTTAAAGHTQGALLLYRIKVVSLDNRPLTVKITNFAESASAELDV
jgi:hypothetical protein